jgi:hypothetical protein
MAEPLENLTVRLEADPFFVACSLRVFAQSKRFDDSQLAQWLGCPVQTLIPLRLCRAPSPESKRFKQEIARIAAVYELDPSKLADAVRAGQAIWQLRQAPASGMLRAARDKEANEEDEL